MLIWYIEKNEKFASRIDRVNQVGLLITRGKQTWRNKVSTVKKNKVLMKKQIALFSSFELPLIRDF